MVETKLLLKEEGEGDELGLEVTWLNPARRLWDRRDWYKHVFTLLMFHLYFIRDRGERVLVMFVNSYRPSIILYSEASAATTNAFTLGELAPTSGDGGEVGHKPEQKTRLIGKTGFSLPKSKRRKSSFRDASSFFLLPLLLVWAWGCGFYHTIIRFLLQLHWYLSCNVISAVQRSVEGAKWS